MIKAESDFWFLLKSSRGIFIVILIHLTQSVVDTSIQIESKTFQNEELRVSRLNSVVGSFHSEPIGETVHVKFLTSLRHKRELGSKEFHILEIERSSFNSTLQIHVVKNDELLSEDFKFVVNDGETRQVIEELSRARTNGTFSENDDCFYTGHLSGPTTGRVVLSSSGEQLGFTGVIMSDQGHFVLEPQTPVKEFTFREGENPEIPHTLSPLENPEGHTPTCLGGIDPPSGSRHARSVPSKPKNKKKMSQRSSGAVHDVRSDGRPVVELAMFGDASFYTKIQNRLKTTFMKAIKNFIVTIAHMMSINFESPSLQIPLTISLVQVEVFTKESSILNMALGNINPMMQAACRFSTSVNKGGDAWDHAMFLTGQDIHDPDPYNGAAVGVAYTGAMCTDSLSCSVMEGDSYRTAFVGTHELGHSLGIDHDGPQDGNGNCDGSSYIMAAVIMPKQTTFSSCSNDNMNAFMAGTGKYNRGYHGNCLVKKSSSKKPKSIKFGSKLPGQKVSAKQQCQAMFGSDYPEPVNDPARFGLKASDICKELYCSKGLGAQYAHPRLEGTDCGGKKRCRSGKCV